MSILDVFCFLQSKMCDDLHLEVNRTGFKIQEVQKTLSLILTKLINPNGINLEGFAAPHTNVTSVTQSVSVTPLTSVFQSAGVTTTTCVTQCDNLTLSNSVNQSLGVTPSTSVSQSVGVSPFTSVTQSEGVTPFTSVTQSVGVTPSTSVTQSVGMTLSTVVTQSVAVTPSNLTQSTSVTPSTSVTQSPVEATPQLSPVTPPECICFETVTSVVPSGVLDSEEIKFIKAKCCSRRNFAVGLVQKLFDEETRKQSNVHGKLGKMKLNPVLMEYIKSLCLKFYPLEESQKEKVEWGKCVVAVDESNRRLKNKPKLCRSDLDSQSSYE